MLFMILFKNFDYMFLKLINYNTTEVVLVPPDEYIETMDALNDYLLLTMAIKCMESYDPSNVIAEAEMRKRLDITQKELDSIGEVEFEWAGKLFILLKK